MRAVDRIAPALSSLLLTGSTAADPVHAPSSSTQPSVIVAATPAEPVRRLLISGHSLTDRPFPDYLAGLSGADGRPLDWDVQYRWGSSLSDRTWGNGSAPWSGYRYGVDRHGRPADVLGDMAHRAAAGRAYDGLILTEQSSLLGNLMWNDTVGRIVDFHERHVAANPQGRTFLFSSWLDHHAADPSSWIAYERAAAPVWACVAARVDMELERRGRPGRIELIPAAQALSTLVAEAIGPEGVPGLSRSKPSATLARLFVDEAHLTPTGAYYVALISYHMMQGEAQPPPWTPPGVNALTASALRQFAARFVSGHRRAPPPTPANCRTHIRKAFLPLSLAYLRRGWEREQGAVMANLKWARFRVQWSLALRSERNPFAVPRSQAGHRNADRS